jgi:hypothetical protein
MMVSADLSRLVPGTDPGGLRRRDRLGGAGLTTPLIRFLTANRQGERYLLATGTAVLAAPIIVQTGEAVMAMGGFMGADPILSPEQLARLVGNQEVRFVLVGDLPRWGGPGGEIPGSQLAVWVRAHGVLVDPTLWRPPLPPEASPPMPVAPAPPRRGGRGFGFRAANWELFDLRPEAGLVPATSG